MAGRGLGRGQHGVSMIEGAGVTGVKLKPSHEGSGVKSRPSREGSGVKSRPSREGPRVKSRPSHEGPVTRLGIGRGRHRVSKLEGMDEAGEHGGGELSMNVSSPVSLGIWHDDGDAMNGDLAAAMGWIVGWVLIGAGGAMGSSVTCGLDDGAGGSGTWVLGGMPWSCVTCESGPSSSLGA